MRRGRWFAAPLDHGINYFDTAADYGESEELLGRALADVPRESYVLATKYLALVDYNDPSSPVVPPAAVGESVDRSLDRLGVEHVDILMIHALEDLPRYESCIASHLRELERIRDSGKTRFLGISGFAPMLVRAVQNGFADMVMVSYNLLSPAPERLLFPPAQAADVGVVAMTAVRRALAHPGRLASTIADMKARGIVASDAVPDDDPLGWLVRGRRPVDSGRGVPVRRRTGRGGDRADRHDRSRPPGRKRAGDRGGSAAAGRTDRAAGDLRPSRRVLRELARGGRSGSAGGRARAACGIRRPAARGSLAPARDG